MIELNLSFVIQLINFGILVLVLNLFLYRPIRKVLADRRQVIDSAREKTVSVAAEAGARRADALKVAHAEEAALLEKARKQASDSLASIRERVAKEAGEARELLKKQAEVLSGDICEKILGRSL